VSAAQEGSVVYGSGALIALADVRNRVAFERHRDRIIAGLRVLVPAVVAAQVVRNPATQARLMRVLRGCELIPFTDRHHVRVGRLMAESGTADVVDGFVALLAAQARAFVVSSDPGDISLLLDCLGVRPDVRSA
jgi:hypothetical protein